MLESFLRALFEHGRIQLEPVRGEERESDVGEVEQLLADWDSANRQDFPGEAPKLSRPVAHWAAQQFYRACRFVVFRDAGSDEMTVAFGAASPRCEPASRHYSVDLTFRYLPDLYRIARAAADDDPLFQHLKDWAEAWPLSSVGIANIAPGDSEAICTHPGLLRLYVDRIITKNDTSRLADPRVVSAVRAALGHFDELSPTLSAALAKAS